MHLKSIDEPRPSFTAESVFDKILLHQTGNEGGVCVSVCVCACISYFLGWGVGREGGQDSLLYIV